MATEYDKALAAMHRAIRAMDESRQILQRLVIASETDPEARQVLERIARGWEATDGSQ